MTVLWRVKSSPLPPLVIRYVPRHHVNFPAPLRASFDSRRFSEWTFSPLFFFFMNERLSLTSCDCDGACRWMCEWSRGEIDGRPLRLLLPPSFHHKVPSNHRRVGWLMLYTHTHTQKTHTPSLKQRQYSAWALYFSSPLRSLAPQRCSLSLLLD